jgi:hypothetical protein
MIFSLQIKNPLFELDRCIARMPTGNGWTVCKPVFATRPTGTAAAIKAALTKLKKQATYSNMSGFIVLRNLAGDIAL